ncbi:MAG: hypothetical protein ACT4PQ_03690 [Betaproteobacteria bacterium]
MNATSRFLGQAVLYGLFALAIGYFSTAPAYIHLAPGEALLKLSFSHGAQRLGECRDRSDEELAKLPPNMRIRKVCPRERAPVIVELMLDGARLYRESLPPSGLSRDGSASVYRRFVVPAGTHRLAARLSDNAKGAYNYYSEQTVTLAPAQILVVEFHGDRGFQFLR